MSLIFGGRSAEAAAVGAVKRVKTCFSCLWLFQRGRKMIGLHEDEGITGKEAVLSTPPRSILRNSRLVIIEGNIGVGKTTLAKKLSHSLDYKLFLEPTIENPYLERFYAQPKKYALSLQLWILRQRYNTYVEAVRHVLTTGEGAILDRSVFSDVVFANVCSKEGYITSEGYSCYETWRQKALQHLPIPHVTVYLDALPQCCHSRIHQRGRECEGGVPLDYLTKLHEEYRIFLDDMKDRGSTVLLYNWTDFQKEEKIVATILQAKANKWHHLTEQKYAAHSQLFQSSFLNELEN